MAIRTQAAEPPRATTLDGSERSRMESIVGGDLSGIVLRTDSAAADRAAREGALAVTEGREIAFARGAYRPGTPAGDALLAHELAHVRQQQGGGSGTMGDAAGGRSSVLEGEADRAGLLAAVLLLDPTLARSLPAPQVSTGRGMQLQRCSPEQYEEIHDLPSRAEYEEQGELLPPGTTWGPLAARLDLGAGWPVQLDESPPTRTPPLPEPDPSAPTLGADQLLARIAVLDARRARIETLTDDLGSRYTDEGGALLIPGMSLAFLRYDLGGAGPTPLAIGTTATPTREPGEVSRLLPRTEEAQLRALDALVELATLRQQELAAHGALEDKGYDLATARASIDLVRYAYARAAADLFGPGQGRLLQGADAAREHLNSRLPALLVEYFEKRTVQGDDIAPAVAEMRDWASLLGAELVRLGGVAEDLRAADERGEDVAERQREFVADAQLVSTSLDALGEWDTAVNAAELLRENSALWGHEAVLRIADRMSQMKDASLARDEPYLRLMVRDHRADPVIAGFYASLADIIRTSHLILGFAVLLIASAVTAGVGIAIVGATTGAAIATESAALAAGASASMAATEAAIVMEIGLVVKIGGEALVFTLVHQGLLATLPGMGPKLTLSSFLTELVWNLALFGVMHGAGSAVEGALGRSEWLRALAPTARRVLQTGARLGGSYATLQAYGLVRFLFEQGRMMSLGELGRMSVENLAMLIGLSVAMKPFSAVLEGIRTGAEGFGRSRVEALTRFRQRYGDRYLLLDSERAQLETRLQERMEQNPQATKADLADIEAEATVLDTRLRELVEESVADPALDVAALRQGMTDVTARLEATPVPELLAGLGLDPAVDLRATGDPATWTVAPGRTDAVKTFLTDQGIPVAGETTTGPRMLEATVAGRGTVTLVERAGTAGPIAPTATPTLDALIARSRRVDAADLTAGLEAIRDQSSVPAFAARLEAEAAAGRTGVVKVVLNAARRLAVARGERRVITTALGPEAAAARFEAARNHMVALEAALNDPVAAKGLAKVMHLSPQPGGPGRVIAHAPVENVEPFLRAMGDPDLSQRHPSFYEGMARNRDAIDLVLRHGGKVFNRIVRFTSDVDPGLQVSSARVDLERTLRGLDSLAEISKADAEARARKIADLTHSATYKSLDKLVGRRPRPLPAFDPIKTEGARWSTHLQAAQEYATGHQPKDGPVTPAEVQVRAALLQTVERAEHGEFGELTPAQRARMLDQFNEIGENARLEKGWISAVRGILNQALARGTGEASIRTVWKNGKLEMTQVEGSTVPDEAWPPVRQDELKLGPDGAPLVEKTARRWIEDKTYDLTKRYLTTARKHAREARDDLTNLPPGSTIALRYAHDPGLVIRNQMLEVFWAEPAVEQVIFQGVVYPRPVGAVLPPPAR